MNILPRQLATWKNKTFIKGLFSKFPKAEVYLVGGVVRDALIDREVADVDLVVRNVSKTDLQKYLGTQGSVDLVGKRFGVYKFKPKGKKEEIDIALPRTEHSVNMTGAYKDFKISSNAKLAIEDDLSRRDFTINAMAWDVKENKLVDPFKGVADLEKKIVRTVGDPKLRFREDYSRMLRAIRFACQLNFNIAPGTWAEVKKRITHLNKKMDGERVVPYEVIAKELIKMMAADPVRAFDLLDRSGGLKALLPDLLRMKRCPQPRKYHAEGDVWKHTMLALSKLDSPQFKKEFSNPEITNELIWGLIYHDLGKPFTITRADRLRFNNHDNVSARLFKQDANKLKLASAGVDVDAVHKIIARHMLPTTAKMATIKDTTLEKYFFNDQFPGQELLMLIFCDISATIPPSGKPDFTTYKQLKKRINDLVKKGAGKKKMLPKPLVTGNDIMKTFKLKSGPKIGELMEIAREAQLNGKIKTKKAGLSLLKKSL